MGEAAQKKATYEDLLRVPEQLVAEILDGELYTQPRPSPRHAIASSVLGGKFMDPFHVGSRGPGGWWIVDEPELHLNGDNRLRTRRIVGDRRPGGQLPAFSDGHESSNSPFCR